MNKIKTDSKKLDWNVEVFSFKYNRSSSVYYVHNGLTTITVMQATTPYTTGAAHTHSTSHVMFTTTFVQMCVRARTCVPVCVCVCTRRANEYTS